MSNRKVKKPKINQISGQPADATNATIAQNNTLSLETKLNESRDNLIADLQKDTPYNDVYENPVVEQEDEDSQEQSYNPLKSKTTNAPNSSVRVDDTKVKKIKPRFKLDMAKVSEPNIFDPEQINRKPLPKIVCSRNGKINRENSKMDNKCFYDYQSPKKKPASENMADYMENFGVSFELPSIYVQDAKMFPRDPRYNLQLINFAFPESDEFEVAIHNLDGSQDRSTFGKINAHLSNGLILRMLVREQSTLKQVDEVNLNLNKAIIDFNQDGTLFGFYYHETQTIKIFEIDTITGFIQQIKDLESDKQEYMVEYDGTAQNLSFIEKIEFDINKRFFVGYGKQSIFILNFESKLGKVYLINTRLYKEVRDVSFESEDDFIYQCYIACRRKNFNQIAIFDFYEDLNYREERSQMNHGINLESQTVLNFDREIPEIYTVKISGDFKQVIFVCQNFENSLIQREIGNYDQYKIKDLGNQHVRYVKRDYVNGGFFMLTYADFDNGITVRHTNITIKNICFEKSIEPDIIEIFDFNIIDDPQQLPSIDSNQDMVCREVRMILRKDQEFQLDKATYKESYDVNPVHSMNSTLNIVDSFVPKMIHSQYDIEYFNYIFSPLRATSIAWPYICITGLGNIVLIMNAFEKRVVRRVQVADKAAKVLIAETFLTETKDLFIIVQDGGFYNLYMIDLDESNEYEQEEGFDPSAMYQMYPLFRYNEDKVGSKPLKQMHIRGSSRKEPIDLNQKLQVYLLHGKNLYVWVQINNSQDLNYLGKCTSKLQAVSDHKFFYQTIIKEEKCQEINMIHALFSHFDKKTVYKETNQIENLYYFNVDISRDKLLIFSKTLAGRGSSEKIETTFKIFDMNQQKIDYESNIHDQALIGRLESGMYTFAGGYYYFNNNVIKLRYDLILGNKEQQYTAEEIFDTYHNCFQMSSNERVRTDTPLNSYQSHRLAYIIVDKERKNPTRVLVVPYLHENRIYLNRMKPSTEYFYTTIETSYQAEKNYHNAVALALSKDKPASSVDILACFKPQASAGDSSINQSMFGKQRTLSMRQKLDQDSFTTVVCVNSTSEKLYMYNQNGLLINRVVFKPLVEAYGEPVQVSNNGQMYIFKKNWEQLDVMAEMLISKEQLLRQYFTFTIVKLTVFGMQTVKSVYILDNLQEYLQFQGSLQGQQPLYQFKKENDWLFNTSFDRAQREIDFEFLVNDRGDFVLRIRNARDFKEESDDCRTDHNVIYYYENFDKISGNTKQDIEAVSGLYASYDHRNMKFIFNRKFLFFWDKKVINYFLLHKQFTNSNTISVNFKIDPQEPKSYIDDLRTGSQPMYICIIVKHTQDSDNVIIWNMEQDIEAESYEIEEDYLVVWDINGKPYIVTDKKAIFPEQRCAVKCYDYEGAIQRFKQKKSKLSVHKGHRVDGKNHNWLIFDEYLSLPFSYMSFVIKDKIENEESVGLLFDPTPYNYIYNKSTSFIDGDFVANDHNQLNRVLEEFEKIDPNLLEIINYINVYYDEDNQIMTNSCLHKAVADGNQRSIDIILVFLSKIPLDTSRSYMSIMPHLIDQLKFFDYYGNLAQRTNAMLRKQVLRANESYNQTIVKMANSSAIYLDQMFFRDSMDDNEKQIRSYPVTIISLKVGWLINEPDGKEFLKQILMSPNMDLYKIEPLQIIIEYLFMKYKSIIFLLVLPLYIFNFISYTLMMGRLSNYFAAVENQEELDSSRGKLITMQIVNGVSLFLFVGQVLNSVYQSGSRFYSNLYSYLDVIFIFQNAFIYFKMIQAMNQEGSLSADELKEIVIITRQVNVLGIIVLYTKASYFLSLVDEVAPLIDIIKQIFYDIRWFVIVLAVYVFMFAQAFEQLGKNQIQFDNLSEEDQDEISYIGTFGSVWYIFEMILGETNTDGFTVGDGTQYPILLALFVFACVTIILHFLNMLIAIMGNTFAERAEVGAQIMTKDHLRFVMDNWLLMNIAFRDKSRIKYIIAAFQANSEDDDNILPKIQDTLIDIHHHIREEFKIAHTNARETHIIVNDIDMKQDNMKK